jgi:hypothetical protein
MTSLWPLRVNVKLVDLVCRDEGDGWGSAEPYLWTAFFKIDGSTVAINPDLSMSGTAQIAFGPGSHGNLGDDDVDAGDVVPIPATIGEWTGQLKAIPLPYPLSDLLPAVSGMVGFICVVMEEDWVSDEGAEAGHQAFNATIQSAFDTLINSNTLIDLLDPNAAVAQLGNLMNSFKDGIVEAIKDKQSTIENLLSWLNPDDMIGLYMETFTQAELLKWGFESFFGDLENEGSWRVRGQITSAEIPTIARISEVAPGVLRKAFRREVETIWSQDGANGLRQWSAAIEPLWPEVAHHLRLEKESWDHAQRAGVAAAEAIVKKSPIPDEAWETAETILSSVGNLRSRKGRILSSRLSEMMKRMRGRTLEEALHILRSTPPPKYRREKAKSERARHD